MTYDRKHVLEILDALHELSLQAHYVLMRIAISKTEIDIEKLDAQLTRVAYILWLYQYRS